MLQRFCVLALVASVLVSARSARADDYKIDPVHSFTLFRILHANASYTYGRINNPEGKIVVDEADPTKTTFDVTLKAANIDTANAQRDTHLKSPDFFSAEEFPTLTFKSTAVKAGADKKLEVTGDLSIHGQTKSVTITLERIGPSTNPRMGTRTGYEGSLVIKRSDFGMKTALDMVGDEVKLSISLEAIKQ